VEALASLVGRWLLVRSTTPDMDLMTVEELFRYLFWMYLGYLMSDWILSLFGIH
jgi:hypothetical protein